jgi:hypothetical protein
LSRDAKLLLASAGDVQLTRDAVVLPTDSVAILTSAQLRE